MYSIYDLLPTGKVVEINKSTGLRIGHMLAQQPMVPAEATAGHAADAQITVLNGKNFLNNGFIGYLNDTGQISVIEGTVGVTAPQPYLHYTEELLGGYSQFLKHYMTKYQDDATKEVYPRMIALYPGDIFTTDNYVGTPAATCSVSLTTGQLDFAATMTAASGALVFKTLLTTLPDGITAAYQFEYIGRA